MPLRNFAGSSLRNFGFKWGMTYLVWAHRNIFHQINGQKLPNSLNPGDFPSIIRGTVLDTKGLYQIKIMSQKNKKQFGVWMDTHHATVVGRAEPETLNFNILGHAENAGLKTTPRKECSQ